MANYSFTESFWKKYAWFTGKKYLYINRKKKKKKNIYIYKHTKKLII